MSPSPSIHKRAEGWGVSVRKRAYPWKVSVRKRTRTLLTTGLVPRGFRLHNFRPVFGGDHWGTLGGGGSQPNLPFRPPHPPPFQYPPPPGSPALSPFPQVSNGFLVTTPPSRPNSGTTSGAPPPPGPSAVALAVAAALLLPQLLRTP